MIGGIQRFAPRERFAVALLGLTILSASVAPLVPIWFLGTRLAALACLWAFRTPNRGASAARGHWLRAVLTAGYAVITAGTLLHLARHPGSLLDRIEFVHGFQLPIPLGVGIAAWDLLAMLALVRLALPAIPNGGWLASAMQRRNPLAMGTLLWTLIPGTFALWSVGSTCWHGYHGTAEDFVRNLAATRGHADWVLTFGTTLALAQHLGHALRLLKVILLAGAFHACLVLAQFALADFSYVIDNPYDLAHPFVRARGNFYYHGSVDQFLLLTLFAVFLADAFALKLRWTLGCGLLIATALALNATRAVSAAIVLGTLVYGMGLLPTVRVRSFATVFAFALFVVFLGGIFYTKPGSHRQAIVQMEVENSHPSLQRSPGDSSADLADFTASQAARKSLLARGLTETWRHPWTGQGFATILIPTPAAIGALESDSSHCLLVDLALGGGWPTLLLVLLWLGGVGLLLAYDRITRGPTGDTRWFAAGLAFLAAWTASMLFFPVERSDLLSIGFAIAGILAAVPLTSLGWSLIPTSDRATSIRRWSEQWRIEEIVTDPSDRWLRRLTVPTTLLVLAIGGAGAVVTSTCHVFPALEFAWQEARNPQWKRFPVEDIHTNSPRLAWLLHRLLPLVGSNAQVHILADDPAELPQTGRVLWDRARDHYYPNVVESLGFPDAPPYGRTLAFRMPHCWQVLYSRQMTVVFLHAGEFASPPITPEELGRAEWRGGQLHLAAYHPIQLRKGFLRVEVPLAHQGPLTIELITSGEKKETKHHSLQVDGRPGWNLIELDLPPESWTELELHVLPEDSLKERPEVVFHAVVCPSSTLAACDAWDGTGRSAELLLDRNHGTCWRAGYDPTVTVDLGVPRKIGMYRLAGFIDLNFPSWDHLSFAFKGSNDGKTWTILDEQADIRFDTHGAFRTFTVCEPRPFRYYQLQFPEKTDVALSEWELYDTVTSPESAASDPAELAEGKAPHPR